MTSEYNKPKMHCDVAFRNNEEQISVEITFRKKDRNVDIRDFFREAMKQIPELEVHFTKGRYTLKNPKLNVYDDLQILIQTFKEFYDGSFDDGSQSSVPYSVKHESIFHGENNDRNIEPGMQLNRHSIDDSSQNRSLGARDAAAGETCSSGNNLKSTDTDAAKDGRGSSSDGKAELLKSKESSAAEDGIGSHSHGKSRHLKSENANLTKEEKSSGNDGKSKYMTPEDESSGENSIPEQATSSSAKLSDERKSSNTDGNHGQPGTMHTSTRPNDAKKQQSSKNETNSAYL